MGLERGFAADFVSREIVGGLIKAGNREQRMENRGEAHKLAARSYQPDVWLRADS
jgi:hypothetical protein